MIEFKHVKKVFDEDFVAVDDFNLHIEPGEFVAFIGTSGSGKTTTMRMINRMIDPTEGQILIDGVDVMDQDPVELRRKIGYVIQNVGLMPHMTIYENIVMVPKLLGWSEEKLDEVAVEMIQLAELPESYLQRYPHELSGGQQQRIGVVRALAADQDTILMDEPFGALDPITREVLQDLVKSLQEELGKTVVFVTHDMDEALKLATKIVIIDKGKIVQVGSPLEILRQPANDFVIDFIGEDRLISRESDAYTIREIMNQNPVTIGLGASLRDALASMRKNRVDTLLVVDDDHRLKGMININMIREKYETVHTVVDAMATRIYSIRQNSLVRNAAERILKRGHAYVPVVDDYNYLVGIVTRSTLVDLLYDAIWVEDDITTAIEKVVEIQEESTESSNGVERE